MCLCACLYGQEILGITVGHGASPGCMVVLMCFANVNKRNVVLKYTQKCKEGIQTDLGREMI